MKIKNHTERMKELYEFASSYNADNHTLSAMLTIPDIHSSQLTVSDSNGIYVTIGDYTDNYRFVSDQIELSKEEEPTMSRLDDELKKKYIIMYQSYISTKYREKCEDINFMNNNIQAKNILIGLDG